MAIMIFPRQGCLQNCPCYPMNFLPCAVPQLSSRSNRTSTSGSAHLNFVTAFLLSLKRSEKARRETRLQCAGTSRSRRTSILSSPLLVFQLEPRLVFLEEFAQVVGHVEQADPLLVIERDREAAQAIDADAALFPHAKFQRALFSAFGLFFEFGDARHEFFPCRFGHSS